MASSDVGQVNGGRWGGGEVGEGDSSILMVQVLKDII